MTDEEPTHRITGYLYRGRTLPGGPRHFTPGDEIAPLETELRQYPDIFEPLDADGEESAETDADEDTSEQTDADTDDDSDSDSGEDQPVAEEPDTDDAAPDEPEDADADADNDLDFSVEQIRDADYPRLRSMASEVDGVDGRGSEDEIRNGLLRAAGVDVDGED